MNFPLFAIRVSNVVSAGSAGDMNAPQLIVENRAVTLEYARDSTHPSQVSGSSEGLGHRGDQQIKSDWLCDTVRLELATLLLPTLKILLSRFLILRMQCGCQNFARRMQCYRCSAPKTESAVAVTANLTSDPFADVVSSILPIIDPILDPIYY